MNFKESLKKHLADRGWTRKQLEEKAGLGDRGLTGYLEGSSDPTSSKLKSISRALGLSMDEAYDAEFVRTGVGLSYDTRRLAELLDRLPSDSYDACKNLIEMLSLKDGIVERAEDSLRVAEGEVEYAGQKQKTPIKNNKELADTTDVI